MLGADRLASGPVPVPLKLTVCGPPLILSAKLKVAVRFPVAEGVNFTLTAQVALGVIAAPLHVSEVLVKSPAFVPASATPAKARSNWPVLVTITVWATLVVPTPWLPNAI